MFLKRFIESYSKRCHVGLRGFIYSEYRKTAIVFDEFMHIKLQLDIFVGIIKIKNLLNSTFSETSYVFFIVILYITSI